MGSFTRVLTGRTPCAAILALLVRSAPYRRRDLRRRMRLLQMYACTAAHGIDLSPLCDRQRTAESTGTTEMLRRKRRSIMQAAA